MQLSLLFTLASTVLAHGHSGSHDVDCNGPKKHEHKKHCLFCPGACLCHKDKYPHGVKAEHCENVFEDVKVRTGCVTEYDVKTSTEVRTQTLNHCETATHVFHPEETYTLTRTESYVVWPAQTSFAKDPCHKGCGKPCHHGSC